MDVEPALEFVRAHKLGTIATLLPDGRPHLSVVTAAVVDGSLWISVTQSRVKTKNLRRDPRATMCFGVRPWVAIEGTVNLHDGDDVLERLRQYYRAAAGEHPNWEEYDRAMQAERRLVAEIVPYRAYGPGL